jgi:hypothetical protein
MAKSVIEKRNGEIMAIMKMKWRRQPVEYGGMK